MTINSLVNILILCSIALTYSCKPPLDSKDFSSLKTGTFFQYNNAGKLNSTVIRKDTVQMEISANGVDTTIWRITWLDSTNYYCQILGLPKSKSPNEINQYKRSVILVSIKSLTKDYYTYQGELHLDEETRTLQDTLWLKKK